MPRNSIVAALRSLWLSSASMRPWRNAKEFNTRREVVFSVSQLQ